MELTPRHGYASGDSVVYHRGQMGLGSHWSFVMRILTCFLTTNLITCNINVYRNGNRKIIYGLGQICKELHITGDHGSFLSKDIILGPTSYVSRLPHRVIAGSNHTHQDIDKQLHSSAVTLGLRDYGILNPFLNRYQQLRDSKFLTTAQLAKARVRADKKRIKKGLYSVNHDNDKDYLDFEAYLTTYMNNALIADLWINHCPVVAASLWKSGAIQPLNNPL